jgi:hypothetical protein
MLFLSPLILNIADDVPSPVTDKVEGINKFIWVVGVTEKVAELTDCEKVTDVLSKLKLAVAETKVNAKIIDNKTPVKIFPFILNLILSLKDGIFISVFCINFAVTMLYKHFYNRKYMIG